MAFGIARAGLDRTVWITGASSGIGRAAALALVSRGARVIASARRTPELEALREACAEPDRLLPLPMDVTDPDARAEAFERARQWRGGFDALIHNAGIGQSGTAADTDIEVDRRIMEVNYFAPVALTKLALPHLRTRPAARLVVVSSIVAYLSPPQRSAYAASKHALHGFFDALRSELRDDDVSVSLVCPGWVASEFRRRALGSEGSADPQAKPRGIAPERCADAVVEAVRSGKRELLVGGAEVWAVYAQRFAPGLVAAAMRRWSQGGS